MSKAGDERLGAVIADGESGDVVLIGFPFDEGCVRNGGRAGAADGPRVFREMLKKTGPVIDPRTGTDLRNIKISDAGDVVGETLEAAHAALEEKVRDVVKRGGIPFVIGGGNDQSYPNGAGYLTGLPTHATKYATVINLDAHFDVRPLVDGKVHSGSPFRLLMESEPFKAAEAHFVEFAAQSWQCSAAHTEYIRSMGGDIQWWDDISGDVLGAFKSTLNSSSGPVFVSFDIDSITSADCPGVSCPAPTGISSWEALQISRMSGRSPSVGIMDMSEFNPAVEGYRTAKLTTAMFYQFCLGVAERM